MQFQFMMNIGQNIDTAKLLQNTSPNNSTTFAVLNTGTKGRNFFKKMGHLFWSNIISQTFNGVHNHPTYHSQENVSHQKTINYAY